MEASPFSGGWECLSQVMGTYYRGMGTSLPMVTPLPRDGKPFAEGWEHRFRRMGTPLPNDGNVFYRGIGNAFAVGREPPSGCGPLYPCEGAVFPREGNPFRKMGAPFPRNGKPLAEGYEHIFRGI